jgi:flagellar M-ring protein FliF
VNPEQILGHLKRLGSTLSIKQIVTLVVVFVGVVGLMVGSAYWINTPQYTLLFSDMDAESAASVVTRLKNDKVDYQLDEGGRTIRVPGNRVDELRLTFASSGMPANGRIGFEIFDRTAFGTTEFLEHVNYRRALEGELARTISTIGEVASARVHIAMAKDSIFTSDTQPAKASVVLKLKNNKPPSPQMVAGISGLVAASVESLRPESVVVVDTFGRSLARPSDDGDEGTSALPLEKERRLEREVSGKVVALLEPVVGPGHVRVNVSALLNPNSQEETEERWDPTTVLRSRQSSSDTGPMLSNQGGVAGSRANMPVSATAAANGKPPVQAAASPATVTGGASRSTETANYEVSKLTRHTVSPRGQLARMSVAVILDDTRVTTKDGEGRSVTKNKPRSADEIQRIHNLVAASVGFDERRGDKLTVENIAFEEAPSEPEAAPAKWWQKVSPDVNRLTDTSLVETVRIAGVLILVLVLVLVVLRPMARKALALPEAMLVPAAALAAAGAATPIRTVADLEGEIDAEIEAGLAAKSENRRLPVLTRRIAKSAEAQPEHIARLVRSLMAEEESK